MWGGGGIEQVGSGQEKPTAMLPLDIPYLKAVDWLVERRVVPSSWPKSLRAAHALKHVAAK